MGLDDPSPSQPISPPPSPIPTGKGSRSAANPTLSQHLTSAKIPKLSLPFRLLPRQSSFPDIDRRSLLRREPDLVNRLLKGAVELGIFRIIGHGISLHDVQSKLPSFSQKIENIWNELERIASELALVLYENSSRKLIIEGVERLNPNLSIHRYNGDSFVDENPSISSNKNDQTCRDYALRLHLPLEQSEFHVYSKQGTLSISADPQTIIVTIGKELEKWSLGEYKSANGELILEKSFGIDRSSFSIEVNCSPSFSRVSECKMDKKISIADQILVMIAIPILYNILYFIFH